MEKESRESFLKLWPIGQFPVLQDDQRKQIIPQSTVIIEYLQIHYPGPVNLIPSNRELALETRRWNEFFDDYIHVQMQKVVSNRIRPAADMDALGEVEARKRIATAYEIIEKRMKGKTWMVGENFSMADCAASPALFYGNKIEPFEKSHPNLNAYLERLKLRPSFARVLVEAEPYFQFFPS